MFITREATISRLAEKSGYYKQDIRALLNALDDLVVDIFDEVTDEDEVVWQLTRGIRVGCKVVPERERVNPKTQEPIVCCAQTKPFVKFSENFRDIIQQHYEERKDG